MTLEVRTINPTRNNLLQTYATDEAMFPNIEVFMGQHIGGESFSIQYSEGDDYDDAFLLLAQGKTRDECADAMREYIKSCVNALGVLMELKHKIPKAQLPVITIWAGATAEEYAHAAYAFGIKDAAAFAVMNGCFLYENQVKWKEVLGL